MDIINKTDNVMEHLLNALYSLTLLESERELNEKECEFYVYCVLTLNTNNINIPFGIEI